jgi:VWFA-related protein
MPRTLSLAVFLAALIVPVLAQQKPTPRFTTGVNMVALDVSVLDEDRKPVRGLTADDFTVLENGKPQPIKTFTSIEQPDVVEDASVAWVRDVQPDVSRNDTLSNRRIVVLVLDDSTPMPAEDVPRVTMMVRKVVDRLGPNDLTAVVYTSSKRYGQNFTTDKARLLAAVDRFNGRFDKQVMLGPYNPDPLQQTARSSSFDEYNPAALTLYSSVVNTLRSLSEYLADLPERRKALIFASVGLPLDVEAAKPVLISLTPGQSLNQDMEGGAKSLFEGLGKTFAAAQRANVNIYSLDPGGLRAPAGQHDAYAGSGRMAPNPGNLNRDFLHAVANNTGGFTIADTNRMDEGITQIFRENGSYYLLGYEPPGPRVPGRFRRIEVKVNRPGVTVRARNGYYEAEGTKTAPGKVQLPALQQPLSGMIPTPGLALQATAAPFALGARKEAGVAIALAVRQAIAASSERVIDQVSAQVNAYDGAGKRRASDALKGQIVLRAGVSGEVVFELLSRLDLVPGHYQLRIAADSSIERKSGSVYCDLDVPDFSRGSLSLSGVVLTATPGTTAARKEVLATLLPVVPTALRDFDTSQQVTAFVRVYAGSSGPIGQVQIATRIRNAADDVVYQQTADLRAEGFSNERAAEYRVDLPMAALQPGPHLLTIEATTAKDSVRRDVRFQRR